MVVYDVETKYTPDEVDGGWKNPARMRFASAVAYDWQTDTYHHFLHEEGRWELVAFLNGKQAITFNGIEFDSRVLLGNGRTLCDDGRVFQEWPDPEAPIGVAWWDNFDILLEYLKVRFDVSTIDSALEILREDETHDRTFTLDALCKATFEGRKLGHGADVPLLYAAEKYAELLTYNLHDVRLTKALFRIMYHRGDIFDGAGNSFTIETPRSIFNPFRG